MKAPAHSSLAIGHSGAPSSSEGWLGSSGASPQFRKLPGARLRSTPATPRRIIRTWNYCHSSFPILCLCCLGLVCGLAQAAVAAEDDDPETTAAKLITPQTEEAIEAGLAWLAQRQDPDGSYGSGAYRGNAAVVALCGLAFMAGGSTPDRGPYGAEVSRCLDYLLANTQQSGFICANRSQSHGPMYGHGFATLFLAQTYGMSKRPELREKLITAVKLIVDTQNKEGGWRYQPQRADADISVTICQVMALRAARDAGLFVPDETIQRCIDYCKASQNEDGGFRYTLQQRESAFSRSAAGVVSLYSAGVYEGPEITKGIRYLHKFRPEEGVVYRESYYYYGHYYAAQAMWQAGGEDWSKWYPAVRDELTQWPGEYRQRKDGSWASPSICPEYATAMALIVLQIPNNCLPIFQR